jgi:IS1 family transposase
MLEPVMHNNCMNRLSTSERTRLIAALVEGNSLRATARMCDVAFNTVLNLLPQIGTACADYHDHCVRNIRARRIQCDEIWQFVGAKKKNATPEQKAAGWGDVWTWVALDADSKLCITYYVGDRGKFSAYQFMQDCAARVIGKPQITTDSHAAYLKAVEDAFGGDANYAMLHKIYGASNEPEVRYSPATVIGSDMKTISGIPDPKHVSTSYVERQNLTMRMSIRRFTRLTNGFSKKVENHGHAVALHFMYYNFVRVHKTLRVTPAMEAGLSDHVWSMEELASLIPEPVAAKRGPYKKRLAA